MKKPDFTINEIPVFHWNIEFQEYDDELAAAKWAWTSLQKLADVFCSIHCMKPECSTDQQKTLPTVIDDDIESKTDEISWPEAQKEFHKAISYLPSFNEVIEDSFTRE